MFSYISHKILIMILTIVFPFLLQEKSRLNVNLKVVIGDLQIVRIGKNILTFIPRTNLTTAESQDVINLIPTLAHLENI